MSATLLPWSEAEPPSEVAIERLLRRDGLSPRSWSNAPGDRYAAHSHPYHKVLYCVRGSITFVVESTGERFRLSPGDRLEVEPETSHSALVGPQGVACVEAAGP